MSKQADKPKLDWYKVYTTSGAIISVECDSYTTEEGRVVFLLEGMVILSVHDISFFLRVMSRRKSLTPYVFQGVKTDAKND